jgi:hypothetical protein
MFKKAPVQAEPVKVSSFDVEDQAMKDVQTVSSVKKNPLEELVLA